MADTNVFITDLPAQMDEDTVKGIFGAYGTVTYGKVFNSKGQPTSAAIVEYATVDEASWVVQNVSGTVPDGLQAPVTVAFKKPKADKGKGFGKSDKGQKGGGGGWGKGGGGDGWGKGGGGGSWGKGDSGGSWGKGGGGGWGKGGDSWGGKGVWQPMFQKTWDGGKGKGKSKGPKIQDPTKVVWVGNVPAEATYKELLELGNHAGSAKWAEVFQSKTGGASSGAIGYATAEEATQAIAMLNGATVGNNTIQTDVYTRKSA
eukprot:TRINITY_DN160_c0_g1_i3.p1 TRINITY_DN160_c0_g1~~TRINITY_DN160_c0_g1_i3.p1  ORF type:complete len:259 (-),score=75.43 TRINITY_DN160_c0_g1_i3:15-791(-)